MELTRSSLTASGAPIAFWDYAITHAIDILNRTSGPSNTNSSSYELLPGEKPRITSILPFGCRAFAVKPRSAYLKTPCGRPAPITSGYQAPTVSCWPLTFISTKRRFSWLPPSPADHAIANPCDADKAQPPGLPPPSHSTTDPALPAPRPLAPASRPSATNTSRRSLLLFSRPFS
eukprot:571434-Pleurochrysis_carterae.AAC.2